MPHVATKRANERSDIILRAVTDAAKAGMPCPSVDELRRLTGLGRAGIDFHLARLVRLDYITLTGRCPRKVRINALGIKTADPFVLRVRTIAAIVARTAGLDLQDILGPRRQQIYVRPRVLVCHFAHAEGHSLCTIARALNRDHSTIRHACQTVAHRLETDRLFRRLHDRVEAALAGADCDVIAFVPAKAAAEASQPRYEIGDDGELQAVERDERPRFDPMLAALRMQHPERFVA